MILFSPRTPFVMAFFLAILAGTVGFSGPLYLLPCTLLFASALSLAPKQPAAFLVVVWSYFLAASFCLLSAGTTYTGSFLQGFSGWFLGNLLVATPFLLVCFFRRIGLSLSLLIGFLPPFGVISWASPFTAAGVVFPSFGFLGLLFFGFIFLLFYRFFWLALSIPLILLFFSMLDLSDTQHIQPGWHGIKTTMSKQMNAEFNPMNDYLVQDKLFDTLNKLDGVVLLPETALGRWSKASQRRWQQFIEKNKQLQILGGTEFHDSGMMSNALVHIDSKGSDIFYRQRYPIPFYMWHIGEDGYRSSGSQSLYQINGLQVGSLLCYEAFVVWPIISMYFQNPDLVVIAGNLWCAADTNCVDVLELTSASWGMLFAKPVVLSYNT